jgi:hypothetical protein
VRDGVAVELADARSDRLDVALRVGVGLRVRERVADAVAGGDAVPDALRCTDTVAEGDAPVEIVAEADAVADAAATGGGSVSLTKMDMVEVMVGCPQHPLVAAPA